jgi:NAD(P)-dependent dehydrogenase (short-subunit alcohol dehydrogenase family)
MESAMSDGVRGQTAVVTGASRGLGRAITQSLVGGGWRLVIDARDGDVLRNQAPGGDVTIVPGDITDDAHRRELVALGGRIHALVLNASTLGQAPLPPLALYNLTELRATIETNVLANLALVQLALPALRAAQGRIVLVTSDAAIEAYPGWGGYGASKAALEAIGRVLAVEEPEVRVYVVDPGDMRTQMHQDAFPGEDISDRPLPETVVPAVRRLLDGDLPSGRYTSAGLLLEPV